MTGSRPNERPAPHQAAIVLWSWSLDSGPFAEPAALDVLTDEERARSRRFVTPQLQRRFVAARAGLRSLLGEHLKRDPRGLELVRNHFGKPALAGSSLHFNLSHSGGMAALAVSDEVEVGCDLEQMRPIEHLDLARRYFHAQEVEAIEREADAAARALVFFRIWTVKEAFVKALGTGLSMPLDLFAMSVAGPAPMLGVRPPDVPTIWWLHQEMLPGGYCRALAAPVDGQVELTLRTV